MRSLLVRTAGILAFATGPLEAQRVEASLALSGGAATDQRGVRSAAITVAPALQVQPDPRISLGLNGTATRFQSADWAAGGTVDLGGRVPLVAGTAIGVSSSASAVTTSYGARYLSLDLTPTVEATLGRVTVFGGAHVAQGRATLAGSSAGPSLPIAGGTPAPTGATSVRRSGAGPVYGAVLAMPANGGALTVREERMRVAGFSVVDRAIAVSMSRGGLAVGALVGARDAADEQVAHGELRGSIDIRQGVAVQGALGSYPSSRMLGTPGGRYATLGLMLRRAAAPGTPARTAGLPPAPRGTTRLLLRAPGARRVELAGDWNNWAATPATRGSDGRWFVDVRLPRGEYRYAFRVDGARWTVPEGVATLDDGFGGRSALLTVP